MGDHKFKIIGPAYGELDLSNPKFIFRIVNFHRESENQVPSTNDVATVTEDGLEDPSVDDFFIVHHQIDKDIEIWVCEMRGLILTASWIVKPLGFKGTSIMDAGYFYAPHVPITTTPVVLDPASFTPNKGILTRYGKKLLKDGARHYGKVEISKVK